MKMRVLFSALSLVGTVLANTAWGWDTKGIRQYSETPASRNVVTRAMVGLNGDYGLMGAEMGLHMTPHLEVHGGVGVGPAVRSGGGMRLLTSDSECFFTKFCLTQYFVGFTATHGKQTVLDMKQDDGTTSKIKVPEATYLNVNVGTFDYFFRHLHTGLVVGYQTVLNKKGNVETVDTANTPKKRTLSEQQKKDEESIQFLMTGFQISGSLGIAF